MCACSVVSDSATPWTVACQTSLSMEFSRQEYWSGLPFPTPGIESESFVSPALVRFLTSETYMQVNKQQLELDMERQTGSKQEKEYVKAVYCHPAYLTSMQSTS